MHRRYRLVAVVAVVAALSVVGLSACGGGPKSPGVASLNGSSGAANSPTTTLPKGNPSQLVDEWATCMRSHGMPNVADPTIDAGGTIHITLPSGSAGNSFQLGSGPCQAYLTAASQALGGPTADQSPNPAQLLAFSECMRAHGIPDFPDPSGGGLAIHTHPGSDLNPHNPTFAAASKTCSAKTGVPGFGTGSHKGGIEVTAGGGPPPGGGAIGGGSGHGVRSINNSGGALG